jgi:hypothetical protein
MSVKTASKKAGVGVLKATGWLAIEMWNGPRKERIEAIDAGIKALQEERLQLVKELIDKDDSQ